MGKRRGDWSGEEQSHYLHQQQQVSQQAMQQDYQHPHQPLPTSPNTSTWSNIVVKEETAEDKANDSGVSPGYSNSTGSPISHGSRSIRNGSVSPGSVNSGDSQQTPMNFECSTQNILNNSTSSGVSISPTVAPQQPKIQEKAMDLGNRKKDSRKTNLDDVIIYTCPVCQFSSIQRLDFAEHLTAHYKNREGLDVLPVYNPNSRIQRATSIRGGRYNERSDPIGDFMDEPGVRTPKYNSQGKIKTYRCKQCAFVAITKLVFWAHSRVHLKSDKMLICPRCPFVTEYKHHLEYHLRNHYGSKPYRCEKCPYACVNRSMLTSHMKSHSNVYQYRCSDCNYLTKYCHSLKLHLRKYNHKPAMVLNPDGSPNPLPIIDVYGTRRGPKQKSAKSTGTKSTQQKSIPSTSKGMPTVNQLAQLGALPLANGFNPLLAFNPFNPLFTGFPVITPVPQLSPEQSQAIKANILAEYATAMAIERLNATKLAANNSRRDNNSPSKLQQPLVNEITDHSMDVSSAPLDLSKRSPRRYENVAEPQQKNHTIDIQHDGPLNLQRNATLDLSTNYEVQLQKLSHVLDTVDAPTKTKNRRKGKAVKLNRKPVENDVAIPNGIKLNGLGPTDVVPNTITGEYKCTICDISFGNEVMYMVHIGYHGYKDVFTCNMCGQKCDDKVTFFLHIARANHT